MPEDNIYTLQDIKEAAHDSIIKKWQRRWEIGETGRTLFEKTETVGKKIDYDYPSKHHFSLLIQLRTGYCKLNYYKHQTGQDNIDPKCDCGEMETVCHYLLECPKYEDIRADMMKDLINTIGLRNINLATLLGQLEGEDKENYSL